MLTTDDLVPPDDLIAEHSGGIDRQQFIQGGDDVLTKVFVPDGHVTPAARVLDIGCGCGRVARPLAHFLTTGTYDGLDLRLPVIEWCRNAYGRYPNFRFHHADIRNSRYNPGGALTAAKLRLPFERELFDLVFLGSVFTHMLPDGVANYLTEIARVMKPTGLCLATFFILDEESSANRAAGRTVPSFAFPWGEQGCRIDVLDIPEAAIAYPEDLIRTLYGRSGQHIAAIDRGQWGRGSLIPNMQDAVWSRRAAS